MVLLTMATNLARTGIIIINVAGALEPWMYYKIWMLDQNMASIDP